MYSSCEKSNCSLLDQLSFFVRNTFVNFRHFRLFWIFSCYDRWCALSCATRCDLLHCAKVNLDTCTISVYILEKSCFERYLLHKKNSGKLTRVNFLLECIGKTIEDINSTRTTSIDRQSTMKPTRFIGKYFPAHRRKLNSQLKMFVCSKK